MQPGRLVGFVFFPPGIVTNSSASTLYITSQVNYVTVCDASNGKVIKELLAQPDVSLSYGLGQPAAGNARGEVSSDW